MTTINFNPASRIITTPRTPQLRRLEPQNIDERLLIERLFGKGLPQPEPAKPIAPAANNDNHDEFAPNLGRHLDVLA